MNNHNRKPVLVPKSLGTAGIKASLNSWMMNGNSRQQVCAELSRHRDQGNDLKHHLEGLYNIIMESVNIIISANPPRVLTNNSRLGDFREKGSMSSLSSKACRTSYNKNHIPVTTLDGLHELHYIMLTATMKVKCNLSHYLNEEVTAQEVCPRS